MLPKKVQVLLVNFPTVPLAPISTTSGNAIIMHAASNNPLYLKTGIKNMASSSKVLTPKANGIFSIFFDL